MDTRARLSMKSERQFEVNTEHLEAESESMQGGCYDSGHGGCSNLPIVSKISSALKDTGVALTQTISDINTNLLSPTTITIKKSMNLLSKKEP